MRNYKHLYDHHYDVYEDSDLDDEIMPGPRRSKAIAIGAIITFSVIVAALKLWNVFQRP